MFLTDYARRNLETRLSGLEEMPNENRDAVVLLLAALRSLDEGRWGICSDCGTPIEPRRLSHRPETTRCEACASHAQPHG